MRTTLWLAAAAAAMIPALAIAAPRAAPYKAPRTAFGQPDLQGVWTNVTITTLERPAQYGAGRALTREQAAKLEGEALQRFVDGDRPTDPGARDASPLDASKRPCQGAGGVDCGYNSGWKDSGTKVAWVDGEPRTSFITTTADGRVPPARARVTAIPRVGARGARTDNPETFALGERCLTSFGNSAGPVMLPLMYNNNYKLVQSKEAVAILVEMVHDVRVVRLNAAHRTDGLRPWFGDSIGRWEGETLVVETTNFPRAQAFRGAWEQLKVTERFTRRGPGRLLYQFTVEDPTVWNQAWGGEYEFTPSKGEVYEYACHEGNYAMEGMLAGAREEERTGVKSTAQAAPAEGG
jgi:hypothetical protein